MGARAFNLAFCGLVALGVVGAMLSAVALEGRLPAPPFTATTCIDDKFRFLHERDLEGVNFVAIGSSVTLHNLDLSVLHDQMPGVEPLNAAPCHLYVDQTAYMAKFLVSQMPQVSTVLTVMSPRDFGTCASRDTMFFDDDLARWYVFGKHTGAPVYLQGLGSSAFLRALLSRHSGRPDWDAYGTHPMRARREAEVAMQWDPACFAALEDLEQFLAERDVRLIVATFPPMPSWAAAHDPDGRRLAAWHRAVRKALRAPKTILVDGRQLQFAEDEFADPLHLLWPHPRRFTEHIAKHLKDTHLVSLETG